VLSIATQALMRTISKVAGAEIVQDAVAFFQAFEGMEEGFSLRATAVRELLADPATAYVLVTSPRPDSIAETAYFAARLAETGIEPAALVVNRVHPTFGAVAVAVHGEPQGALADLLANHERLRKTAQEESASVADLVAQVAPSPVARVPLLESDVHDLRGLELVAEQLFDLRPVS
jgi:anion-transporting  ArsA/GET3 family ATPase